MEGGSFMLKKILRISFFAIITIIMLLVLFLANDLTEIAHVLKNIKPLWLFNNLFYYKCIFINDYN